MIKKIYSLALLMAVSLSFQTTTTAQETPLIDREIFFGDPEIAGGQISPDGKYISFLKPFKGKRNIWVKGIKEKFEDARPITADTNRPIGGYFWSRDGNYILYVQDKGGDENYHVYSVNPSAPNAEGEEVPSSIDLTPMDGIRAFIMSVPKYDPSIMYVGINDRDPAWHDLYKVKIATGERELVLENDIQYSGLDFDLEGDIRVASKSTPDGGTEFLKKTDSGWEFLYSCSSLETCYTTRFHKNGKVYLVSDKGDSDISQLFLLDLDTKATELIEQDPEERVDFGGTIFSDVTDELIGTVYTAEKTKIYWKDQELEADYNLLKKRFNDAEINFTSNTSDERKWLIYVNRDVDPGTAYYFDRDTKETELLYRPRPNLPVEHLAEMTPVSYKSSDGLEIPAYLTVPKGTNGKNLPAIILPHGGPWARDYWGYDGMAQFLANRGYAVLQPNFRGSTGWGKSFLNAGNGEWGKLMQDDLTWGAKYLIEQGIADEDKVGIMGGSYGGYATLAGLTYTPDVYAAGVSIVGPSNLFTLLESIPPYWESIRELFHNRMGDPDTPEGQDVLKAASPFFHAKNIKAPLLVGQGANDPRVKKAESDQIVVAMRDLGLPVEYLNFPDEGHGFANPDNSMAFFAQTEKFLAGHLGGRYQEDVPDNLQEIIENVTVDISTVKLPEKITEESANAALPMPDKAPEVGTTKYDVTIKMGQEEIKMDMSSTVEDGGDHWILTDASTSEMGDMTDIAKLKKGSLVAMSRTLTRGPMIVTIDHDEAAITGNVAMSGRDIGIDVPYENDVFGHGTALGVTLAQLPLAEGYTTTYRTFNPTSQKVSNYKLTVTGSEPVITPKGKKDSYHLLLEALDGSGSKTNMWMSKDDNPKMLKMKMSILEMGGAKMTVMIK